jgi:uncharacterized membrane protein YhfC
MAVSSIALVGGIGMIAVALGFFGYALTRRLGAGYLGLGALAWFVTVAVKFAIAIPANGWLFKKTHLLADPWGNAVFDTYVGLLTGITEVGLVWIVLRYTQFGRARWPRVLAFGIGFGAIEALLLGVASLAAAIVAIKMPEKLPKEVLDQLLQSDHLWVQLAPISERIFACLGHLGTNVMIFYAVSRRAPRWFWFAFLYRRYDPDEQPQIPDESRASIRSRPPFPDICRTKPRRIKKGGPSFRSRMDKKRRTAAY